MEKQTRPSTPSLILIVALLIFGNACSSIQSSQATDSDRPPNFIIILADDLGYGDLGVYGSTLIHTPNLDRMGAEGVRLTNFYSSANVCTAARGGLLTGRYPIRLDLVGDVARPSNDVGLAADEITLAEVLKFQGYHTGLVGKWHLGDKPEQSPLFHGFDEFFGLLHSNDMLPLALYRGRESIEEPVNQRTLTQRYTAESVRFIDANREKSFFLYLSHTFPHVPLHVSDRFSGSSHAGLYGDVVEELDWSVGEILHTLRRLDLQERTLVVFMSDNGPWWEGSSGNLRDRKSTAWEGGLRVPFIAWWPGTLPAGTISDEPSMNIDLFPTFVRAAGGEVPDDRKIDGQDIFRMLRDDAVSPHEVLYLFDGDRLAAVRSGRWKLVVESRYENAMVRLNHKNSYYGDGLLFDLEQDPSETYSFTREFPDIVKRLNEFLQRGEEELSPTIPKRMWSVSGRCQNRCVE